MPTSGAGGSGDRAGRSAPASPNWYRRRCPNRSRSFPKKGAAAPKAEAEAESRHQARRGQIGVEVDNARRQSDREDGGSVMSSNSSPASSAAQRHPLVARAPLGPRRNAPVQQGEPVELDEPVRSGGCRRARPGGRARGDQPDPTLGGRALHPGHPTGAQFGGSGRDGRSRLVNRGGRGFCSVRGGSIRRIEPDVSVARLSDQGFALGDRSAVRTRGRPSWPSCRSSSSFS